MDLARMRKNYDNGELTEEQASNVPTEQFERWFLDAIKAKEIEPNAMTVATVNAEGHPATRVVLMKEQTSQGIVFYTNYNSRKAQEIAGNPNCAAQFYWPNLVRVVRIEGLVEKISAEESDAYFQVRPLDSRIGAWASPQSQTITSRAVLLANAAKYSIKYGLNPPRPPHWGGYRLVPKYWEFWRGRKSRLHDRLCYKLANGKWSRERLAP